MAYVGTNNQSYIGNNPRTITGDELAVNVITANNIVDNSVIFSKLDAGITNRGNASFETANSSFLQANAGFIVANSAQNTANSGFNHANSSFNHANSAFNTANTVNTNASRAYNHANSSFNHANSAFNTANTANGLAQTALQPGSAVQSLNNIGGNTYHLSKTQTRKTYGNIGSGWDTDWTGSRSAGTFCRTQRGGGHNATDAPVEVMVSKYNEKATTMAGQIAEPYDASYEPAQLKKFYWNASRNTWSQREDLFATESVTTGNRDAIGLNQLRYGDPNSWDNTNIYFYAHTPTAGSLLATQNIYAEAGPVTGSPTLAANDIVYFKCNGMRARITWTTSTGVSGIAYASDYGGTQGDTSWTNDSGSTATIFYSYFIHGDDVDRTFAKIYTRTPNATYSALTSTNHLYDRYGNVWQYYWQNQRVYDGQLDAVSLDNSTNGLAFNERRDRLFTTKSMTLPATGSNFYSIAVKMSITKGLDGLQPGKESANISNLWFASTSGSGPATDGQGFLITLNASTQYERRVYFTAYTGGSGAPSALVTNLKVWQFDNDDDEDISFHWSWNALDTVAPGRFYVNDILVFTTTTNPLPTLSYFNVGSTTNGTSNGFTGVLKMLSVMPESWGVHNVQGSITSDWDIQPTDGSYTGSLASTTYNGGATSTIMSTRNKAPKTAYIHSNSSTPDTIFPYATRWAFDGSGYTVAGSTTASCTTVVDDSTVTFAGNNRGGWHDYGGTYLVTGTGIRTDRNVYTSLTFGAKTFTLRTHNDEFNTASSSGTNTLTFTRINGGRSDDFNAGNNGLYEISDNPPSVAKTNNTAKYLGNCLGCAAGLGNATNAYVSPGAFAQLTLAITTGSSGDDPATDAGNGQVKTTNTTGNDQNVRRLMNMIANGKKMTVQGTGIRAADNDYIMTYITGVGWDHYGRGLHRIDLSQTTGVNPSGTFTFFYVPHNGDTYSNGLDYTGGSYTFGAVACNYDYSVMNSSGGLGTYATNEVELEYQHGYIKIVRNTPPKGVYDSGIFRATAATTSKRMGITYAATGYLINYGAVPMLNRSSSNPSVTVLTTQITANGVSVATTSGNFYRIIIVPLSTNFTVS